MDTPAHFPDGHKGAFGIERDGRRLATMTYSIAGDIIIIDHTEVDAMLRGTGAGAKLVAAAVAWARSRAPPHHAALSVCQVGLRRRRRSYADVLMR